MYAKVIIDLKAKNLDRFFDYVITPDQSKYLEKGMRVLVPFGSQKRLGYVIDIVSESEAATKEIIEVLDIIPSLSQETFTYINYLLSINHNLYINAIETVIPSELFLNYYKEITIINKDEISDKLLNLFGKSNSKKLINAFLPFKAEIKRLIKLGAVKINNIYAQKGKTKYRNVIVYLSDNDYPRINNYLDLIAHVKANGSETRSELQQAGFSLSSINTLIKNGVFGVEEERELRESSFIEQPKIKPHKLNAEQLAAYNAIKNNLNKQSTYLLHGITGSGKTEVYMHLMKDVLANNKKVLLLVPEITLVAPLMEQLSSRFNQTITHYNSNLSAGEKYDAWDQIINNKTNIIVGTRSSIFLPIEDLGLIIVDEEHDQSYVQTDRIQYDTMDIINLKAKMYKTPIILGSATPSVKSMYLAKKGKYKLLTLTKRATDMKLPKIHYIDMKEELKQGNTKVFSNLLYDSINDRLAKGEQTILLFNRKGFAPFTMCRECGHIPACPNCDVSLTYYKKDDELKCHHCGHFEPDIKECPICKSDKIRPIGIGVEQIEYAVRRHFPKAKTVRMDASTTTRKGSHEAIWNDFKNGRYDILIGTQMVSKGLNFPKVTLVGILMADLHLKIPSYFATEQTYALLTQMSGRSGREQMGEAIIQGYNLDHYAIKGVEEGYDYFYEKALYERKISKYIPFYEVSQLLIMNESYLKAYQVALRLKRSLEKHYEVILGPAESIIKYIKNEYRFIITIKDKKMDTKVIFEMIEKFQDKNTKIYYYNIPEIM